MTPQKPLSGSQTPQGAPPGPERYTGLRWGLYARVSEPQTGSSGLRPDLVEDLRREAQKRLDEQLDALREMVAARKGTVSGIYRVTGPANEHPEHHKFVFDAMMAEFDRVAVIDLSRLADSPADVVNLAIHLNDDRIGITVVQGDDVLDDPTLDASWVAKESMAFMRRHSGRRHTGGLNEVTHP
ncbi:hypothetical protein GCM10020001_119460 [Nonomuraea salmonea]